MDTRDAEGGRGLVSDIDRQLMYERRRSAPNDRSIIRLMPREPTMSVLPSAAEVKFCLSPDFAARLLRIGQHVTKCILR